MTWALLGFGPEGWGDQLLRGLTVTLALSVVSYGLGIGLGLLWGVAELGRGAVVPRLVSALAAVLRSLPELLIIFFIYYALAYLANDCLALAGLRLRLSIDPFTAGVISLALIIASYAAEVTKGALRAVPVGAGEAARALGLSRWHTLAHVTLPLALRYAFPGLANLWMVLIKTTPFVSAIQLEDFIRVAGTAGQNTRHYFLFYGASIFVYLLISGASMFVQFSMERRLFRHIVAVRP